VYYWPNIAVLYPRRLSLAQHCCEKLKSPNRYLTLVGFPYVEGSELL